MTGSSYERELVNLLHDLGFGVMRAPSSGSATERELPDLTADRTTSESDDHWAIEAKCAKGSNIYVEQEEVENLVKYTNRTGHTPLLAARWKRAEGWNNQDWYFSQPVGCHQTDGGSYRLSRPESPDDWVGMRIESGGVIHR